MSLAPTVGLYLCDKGICYEIINHPYSVNALETAQSARIAAKLLAKAVIMRDEDNALFMVLTQADKKIQLKALNHQLDKPLSLVPETELAQIFPDCEPGAIPPLGQPYGLRTLIDYDLLQQDEVYLEAGDHLELVHLTGSQFQYLMKDTSAIANLRA